MNDKGGEARSQRSHGLPLGWCGSRKATINVALFQRLMQGHAHVSDKPHATLNQQCDGFARNVAVPVMSARAKARGSVLLLTNPLEVVRG